MKRTHDEFWSAYRDRAYPLGTFYIAAYRRGLAGPKETTFYIPVGPDLDKARAVFLATIRDLRTFKRLSRRASVQLLEIRDDIRLQGCPMDYASEPVHQWVNEPNSNFPTWSTGPTHYLDNRRADIRRGWWKNEIGRAHV